MSPSTDSKIKARVEEFVQELSVLIHEAALDAVQSAIAGVGFGAAAAGAQRGGTKRGRKPGAKAAARPVGRPAGKKAAAKAGKKTSKKSAKKASKRAAKKGGRVRRGPQDLGALGTNVVAALKTEPGQSISQIATAVGVAKAKLQGPLAQLLDENKIKKTGQRRGTKYFAK